MMNPSSKDMPETKPLAIHILGIGEITTTIEVKGRHWGKIHPTQKRMMKLAYKRMPAFATREAMDHYIKIHLEYQVLLKSLGIPAPWHDNLTRQRQDQKWVVYNRQERFPANTVACLIIQDQTNDDAINLFNTLLLKMEKLFQHNLDHPKQLIGLDAQISNWILPDYGSDDCGDDDGGSAVRRDNQLILYIDTSTPMLRYDGLEQLDTELFLQSIPALFRPIVRHGFLQQVLDRYYIPREIILDLVASYITHHRPDLVPAIVDAANHFLKNSPSTKDAKPFTIKQIQAYNREDVMIWHFFRTLKRIDRYVSETLLGKTYEQRLPHGPPKTWKNLVGAGGQGLSKDDE